MHPHGTRLSATHSGRGAPAEPAFVTLIGDEVAALTQAEMREIDRIAVEETGPGLLQMMENAGRSMAILVVKETPRPLSETRVLVVAGGGGNGGGGVCAARRLLGRVGCVELCLTSPHRLTPATADQLRTYRWAGGAVVALSSLSDSAPYDVIVDAVLGYGLRGAPTGDAATAIEWIGRSPATVISLDLPSGVDPDTGETPGVHVDADTTLTLHMPKAGLANPAAGWICLADLGIPVEATRRVGLEPPVYGPAFITRLEILSTSESPKHRGA